MKLISVCQLPHNFCSYVYDFENYYGNIGIVDLE